MCFVPQKPYLSTSTLLAQVVYPDQGYCIPPESKVVPFCAAPLASEVCDDCDVSHEVHTTDTPTSLHGFLSPQIDEARAIECLRLVGLENLQTKHGLHVPIDWLSVLSVGEQQRVAMARVYYHRPTFAVLDEATSAMSSEITENIYRICRSMDITMITIAHDVRLAKYHCHQLQLTGSEGGWSIDTISSDTPC